MAIQRYAQRLASTGGAGWPGVAVRHGTDGRDNFDSAVGDALGDAARGRELRAGHAQQPSKPCVA